MYREGVRFGDDFSVTTPSLCTSSGRRGIALLTLFCTKVVASSGSLPIAKVTVNVVVPAEFASDDWYSMFSTPFISCSSTVATVSAITLGFAPG